MYTYNNQTCKSFCICALGVYRTLRGTYRCNRVIIMYREVGNAIIEDRQWE